MALETYLDFAENDYKFFMINYRNHVIANAMGTAAQGICEKYMKHLISEYMNPETKEELAKKQATLRTHSLNRLSKYIMNDMEMPIPEETRTAMGIIDGFYFSTRYPGDDSIEINEEDLRHCEKAIEYILDGEKTKGGFLAGGNCGATPEAAYGAMMDTKMLYGKNWDRQGYHFVLSFPPGEVTAEKAMELMNRFCERYFGEEYDYVTAAHDNQEHKHGHIIFNSVSRDGAFGYAIDNRPSPCMTRACLLPSSNSGICCVPYTILRGSNSTFPRIVLYPHDCLFSCPGLFFHNCMFIYASA